MNDIVNGLRRIAEEGYRFAGDAADEIERLRSSLEAAERKEEMLHRLLNAKQRDHAVIQGQNSALRAKIEQMERQEPAGWQRLHKDGSSTEDIVDSPNVFIYQRPLYALPGAKGE